MLFRSIVPEDAASFSPGPARSCSFGGKDRMLRRAAARLDSALTANCVAHDVMEYREASHGFLNATIPVTDRSYSPRWAA